MFSWVIAALAGAAGAFAAYAGGRAGASRPLRAVAAALRALSLVLVVALALNAPVGARRDPRPLVVLDVSASWNRGRDSAVFAAVASEARARAGDSLLIAGDSLRLAGEGLTSGDRASRIRPAAERASAAGRPLIVYTDGELDDADALRTLPSGSQVLVRRGEPRPDAAVVDVVAPRVASAGDSVEARVTVAAGEGGAAAGRLRLELGGRQVTTVAFDSLPAFGERTVTLRFVAPGTGGPGELRASVDTPGDDEVRNNSSATVLDVTSAAAAVLVSSSPDLDARELAALLRGTIALPTRAYFRVAPGQWRDDASLAAVGEETVRRAVRDAPIVVLHGDTTLFGNPRSVTRGSLALIAPSQSPDGEWFATGAPLSPVSPSLSGTVWDSLAPLDVAPNMPADREFEILETRRARRLDRRVAIVGWERPRRVVVAGASGFWRWRFRGGVGNDAFTAVWGSILDWLAGERPDERAAFPVMSAIRAGDRIAWRRGSTSDSIVTAEIVRRGNGVGGAIDTVTLRFGATNQGADSPPLEPGLYDVRTRGGNSLLVVNPSAEWIPRRPAIQEGRIGQGATIGDAPRARSHSWLFAVILAALCAEWLVRRRLGLR